MGFVQKIVQKELEEVSRVYLHSFAVVFITSDILMIDPHFKTFNGKFFSYHGECDLVLMRSDKFADGLGLLVHVRATRIDKPHASYSYISNAAVKIGRHVLEVFDDGQLLVNGERISDENGLSFSGFMLKKSTKGTSNKIVAYELILGDKTIVIRSNTKTGIVFVDVDGYFADSLGLLGSEQNQGLYSRDGMFDMTDNWNSFGEEWQVTSDEKMLFQEARYPQHPVGCAYTSKASSNLRQRRRLIDNTSGASNDVATKACSSLTGKKTEFCILDIVITGDIELANDPFYK